MHYMEKRIKLAGLSDCTGCMACSNVCPTQSIDFKLCGLHYYPNINNSTCIKCGKCMSVCAPLNWDIYHDKTRNFEPIYYCAWNNDNLERFLATSGGVGGALAKYALEKGWYVCGAAFDDEWKLKHEISNEMGILERIRGSKYLQSNTDNVYSEIVKLLQNGEKVLFLGTPCQADGLRNITPLKYKGQLLISEIICHGVNSPVVWNDYKRYIEKQHNKLIIRYNFRSKSKDWGKCRVLYQFVDGESVDVPAYRNLFHSWFGLHYMMRESCFRCKYRSTERYSDIIIGDFWGIEKIEPSLDVRKGASVVIANSEKGQDFIKASNLTLKRIESHKALDVIKGYTDEMPEEAKLSQIRQMKRFEQEYKNCSFEEMAKKHRPTTTIERIIQYIRYRMHL